MQAESVPTALTNDSIRAIASSTTSPRTHELPAHHGGAVTCKNDGNHVRTTTLYGRDTRPPPLYPQGRQAPYHISIRPATPHSALECGSSTGESNKQADFPADLE